MSTSDRFAGKVAVITGGTTGIGRASADLLVKAGYTVYATARREETLAELAAAGARTIRLDVTDEESMKAGVARIMAEAGRIDVLVNNSGYGSYGAIEDVPMDEARRQIAHIFGGAL